MSRFPSDPWFRELAVQVNASTEYREAAATWEGDIAFVIEAEPDKGVPEDVWAILELWHGECRGAALIDEERGLSAPYVVRAPYSRWKDVLLGELEPVKAMMQGKLRLRGDLPNIVRHVRAASELVRLTGLVDTQFTDEVSE